MARNIITTIEQLHDLVDDYSESPAFAFDVETIGPDRGNPLIAPVVWLSMSNGERTDTIPMGHPNGEVTYDGMGLVKQGREAVAAGRERESLPKSYFSKTVRERLFGPPPEQLDRGDVFPVLAPLFFGDALKVGHNIRFDLHSVAKYLGGYPSGPYYDTMVGSWLLDVTRRGKLGLADCFKRETGLILVKGVGEDISKHTFAEVAEYSLLDAEATIRVKNSLDRRYAKDANAGLSALLDIEHEVIHAVLEMESTGVRIDIDSLSRLDSDLRRDVDALQSRIFLLAGRRFNLRSIPDKQRVLFTSRKEGGMGLRPLKPMPSAVDIPEDERTISHWSVDQETLEKYAGRNEFVDRLLDYNLRMKLHGTYVLPYLGGEEIRARGDTRPVKAKPTMLREGRVFGRFIQTGAETGRFSSRDPNLQNIPARTDYGKRLREIFVADPGHRLIVADYSQIEPRIIASLSRDATMLRTYNDGGDVYQAVADRMGVTRAVGKELVLSIAYGIGPFSIAARIGCTVTEARELMEFFNNKFSAIGTHKQAVLSFAKSKKYAVTVLGRRRPVPGITSRDEGVRASAQRQAYNHVVQGTAADIMKIALVNIYRMTPDPDRVRLLLTVHDEVVVQAPDDLVEETVEVVRAEMEAARPRRITVPLVADVHHGRTWAEGKTG